MYILSTFGLQIFFIQRRFLSEIRITTALFFQPFCDNERNMISETYENPGV